MQTIRFFCWLFCCLLLGQASGQGQVVGKISDVAGQPIRGANVLLRKQAKGAVLAFGASDAVGNYSVKIPAGLDSFWLSVTHLSYASQEQFLYAEQQKQDWTLQAEAYELPVMEVKQEAVVRRGDTLIFDVNQLRQAGDENIEQLLSNIPGITIEPSGLIRYQGLEISKFYIEGLDLLEGRYRIATRNLRMDAIRDVEIWEHHQPIRALDSLVRPDNAAINLRLKSSIALTGKIQAATGLSPALYQAGGDVFGFAKQQQFHLLADANNTGLAQQANFQDLYSQASVEIPLLSPTLALPPFLLAEENVRDNQERIAGINLLRRQGKNGQLKWQAFGSLDRLRYQGRNELSLNDGSQEVRFIEELQAVEKPWQLNNRLLYEHNAPRFYLKAKTEADWQSRALVADNVINGNYSGEDFQQGELLVKGRFEALVRRGEKAYQIFNQTDYQRSEIDFFLLPLDVFSLEMPSIQLSAAWQRSRQSSFRSDTYSSFIFRYKKLQGQVKTGWEYQRKSLDSDLLERTDSSDLSLGLAFQNEVRRERWVPYWKQRYRLQGKQHHWDFSWPIAWHQVQLVDVLRGDSRRFSPWVTKPALEWLRNFASGNSLSVTYQFKLDYDQEQHDFYSGYILRQNRQLTRGLLAINRYSEHELQARWRASSREKSREFESFIALSAGSYDFLQNTIFGGAGQSFEQISRRNTRRQLRWENRLGGSIGQHWQYKLLADYRFSTLPNQLNGNTLAVQNHFARLQPYLAFSLGNHILSCKPQLTFFASNTADLPVWQQQITWVYFQQLGEKWGDIRLQWEQYRTQIGERSVRNQLLNFRYKRKISPKKLDVSLQINNLTAAREYISFSQYTFVETLSYFQLRPRQLILALTWQL